jgi:MFS family permease
VSYLGELRRNGRPLLAASLGLGTSLPLDAYVNSIFAAHLIKEFGWDRSMFALYGLVALATIVVLPFVGRFTDRLGVRRVALVGTVLMLLVFIGYSQMTGSFALFMVLSAFKLMCGHMTSAIVYTRLIAAHFDRARGLALTIVNCAPAVLGALAAPALTASIDSVGWRTSYLLVGVFMFASGLIAVLLVPREDGEAAQGHAAERAPDALTAREAFGLVARSGVFWIMVLAIYLIMIATPLQSSQLAIMLEDNGLGPAATAWIISVFSISTIVGRIACGLALDKFPTPVVASVCTLPPALGFFLLATDWNSVGVIAFSMALAGFAVGAENDLFSFLVARYFKLEVYSSTLSLVFACVFMGTATGSVSISGILAATDSFSPFLYMVAGSTLVGSLLFLLLPRSRVSAPVVEGVGSLGRA